jgi:uncharacterized delta-60 repeat protein
MGAPCRSSRRLPALRRGAIVGTLVLAVLAPAARAAPGQLDATFGSGGKQTVDFGGTDRATHVAVARDGRVVVVGSTDATGAGDYAVARLLADGTPDASFGGSGKVTLGTQPGVADTGGGVAVLPDERIVVAGQGNSTQDFVTKQLNPGGGLDTTFATGGTSVVDFGGNDVVNNLARQPDGKLVLVGATSAAGGGDFAVARLNPDGSIDSSFGSGGKQTVDFGGNDSAYGVAVQADGKLVVAGRGDPVNEMVVARLNPDGSIDSSFGSGGEVAIDFGGASGANAVGLQPDGKIVLVGSTAVAGNALAIARLTPSGALDTTFNHTGKLTLGYGGTAPFEAGLGVAVQANGRIVVMGTGGAAFDFKVTRLESDGSIDRSFGAAGTATVDFGGGEFDGDVALASNGNVVIAGSTNVHDGGDLAVARMIGDPVSGGGGGGGGGTGGGGGPGPITIQPPSGPLSAGKIFQVTVKTTIGVNIDRYEWDLNGDGKPDVTCGGANPILQADFPRAYSGIVGVKAFGLDGSSSAASLQVRVGPGSNALRSLLLRRFGRRIAPFLLPSGVSSRFLSATCLRPPSLPKVKVTLHGGPPPGCTTNVQAGIERAAVAGIVDAIGCFTRATKVLQIPAPERKMLEDLDTQFARALAAHGLAAGDGGARAARDVRAKTAISLVQYAQLLLQLSRGLHVTTKTARVNGLDITPLGGSALVLEDGLGIFTKDEAYLVSSNASVSLGGVELRRGPLALKVGFGHPTVHVADFDTSQIDVLAPFLKLNRGTSSVDFVPGKTELGVHVLLPAVFGGVTSDATVTLDNVNGAELSYAHIHADGFQVLGVGIPHADLLYQRHPLTISANVEFALGEKGPDLKGYLEFGENNGDSQLHFHQFYGSYTGPPFINLSPGVDITTIRGGFQLFPPATVLHAGATINVGAPPDTPVECPPYKIDGDADVTFYPPPFALDARTGASMFCQHVANEFLHVDSTGYVHFGGDVNFDFDVFKLDGHLDARFFYPHFTAQGQMHGCLGDYACVTGNGVISDRGVALCYSVFLGVKIFGHRVGGTVQVGGGIDWPPVATLINPVATAAAILSSAHVFLGSCDFSHYITAAREGQTAAAGGGQVFTVTRGQRAIALAVHGAGGVAPDVEIRGPDRPPIVLPASGPLRGRTDAIGFRSTRDGTAYVVIGFPSAGRWTVAPLPGSSAITGLATSLALPKPSIRLTRRPGRGGQIVYAYRIQAIRGQRVTFLEEVGGAARALGSPRGDRGTLSFFPSTAAGTRRSIVAVVTQDGRPRTDITVARFTARPTRPARPPRLRAHRRGTKLLFSWAPAAHAERYVARVSLSDGRILMFFVTARARSFTITGVARRTTASVSVVGLLGASVRGPAATLHLRGHGRA